MENNSNNKKFEYNFIAEGSTIPTRGICSSINNLTQPGTYLINGKYATKEDGLPMPNGWTEIHNFVAKMFTIDNGNKYDNLGASAIGQIILLTIPSVGTNLYTRTLQKTGFNWIIGEWGNIGYGNNDYSTGNNDNPLLESKLNEEITRSKHTDETFREINYNIQKTLGSIGKVIELDSSNFAKLRWDGTTIMSTSDKNNSYIVPLFENVTTSWEITGTSYSAITFDHYPQIGDIKYINKVTTKSIIPTYEEKYLMVTVSKDTIMKVSMQPYGIYDKTSMIEECVLEVEEIPFTEGYVSTYNKTVGDIIETDIKSSEASTHIITDVSYSERVIITAQGTAHLHTYTFIDKNNRILETSGAIKQTNQILTIPENAVKLIVQNYYFTEPSVKNIKSIIKKNNSAQIETSQKLSTLRGEVERSKTYTLTVAGYYNTYTQNSIGSLGQTTIVTNETALTNNRCLRIEVFPGMRLNINAYSNSDHFLAFYILNSEGYIVSVSEKGILYKNHILTVPKGGRFLYMSSSNNYSNIIEEPNVTVTYSIADMLEFNHTIFEANSRPLSQMKILQLGDSITEIKYNDKGIAEYLEEFSGTTVFNCAIGGSQISRRSEITESTEITSANCYAATDVVSVVEALVYKNYSTIERAIEIEKELGDDNSTILDTIKSVDLSDIDIITILASANDWKNGVALGVDGDKEVVNNITGAFDYIIKTILTAYPHISIYVFTPTPRIFKRNDNEDDSASWSDYMSVNDINIDEVCERISSLAYKNHLPCCNLYRTLGWNYYNIKNFLKEDSTDGTHPYRGFAQIAAKQIAFIEHNLCNRKYIKPFELS